MGALGAPVPSRFAGSEVSRALSAEAVALLDRMLLSHAYRELAAARLFAQSAALVSVAGAAELRAHAAEEERHLDAVCALWSQVVRRPREELLGRVRARAEERPLPPAASAVDLAMARFLYDRAGFWQLGECVACSFAPYGALARRIVADERGHQDAGAATVSALCATDAGRAAAQAAFAPWLRVALLSFGRAGSAASARAVALGLKRRDPAAVIADFIADIVPTVRAAGLTWSPAQELGVELPPSLAWPPKPST